MFDGGNTFNEKNVFDYHSVIASALSNYFNLRTEAEDQLGPGAAREGQARAILRSCIIYSIKIKPDDYRNQDIPTGHLELSKWITEREIAFGRGKNRLDYLDALFSLATEKMEIAGLTASKANDFTPQSDRVLASELEGE